MSSPAPLKAIPLKTIRTRYTIDGIDLTVADFQSSVGVDEEGNLFNVECSTSVASDVVVKELVSDTYRLKEIGFAPGDVVLDLGGHVGIVSIYLAKKYPFLKIYAYEPSPDNYRHFLDNLDANGISNVQVFNQAVTAEGRTLNMIAYYECNSGGATGQLREMKLPHRVNFEAQSTTLDSIFRERNIEACKLLKVDVEGSEYEVLMTAGCLNKVEFLAGEFHENDYLLSKGYSISSLYEHLTRFIPQDNIRYVPCRMAE
jgi:FkbM family methyltransferase